MCGIVGLFLKNEDLRPKLGEMLTDMLITMTDRGPDSAGIAIYGAEGEGVKITVQSDDPAAFEGLEAVLAEATSVAVGVKVIDTHAVLTLPEAAADAAVAALEEKGLRIMARGASMEIFKEVGLPRDVAARFVH